MSTKSLKLSLSNNKLAEAFFEDARLLGIMMPEKEYQFCWRINNFLGMQFKANLEIEIRLKKKERDYYFSVYEYFEPTGTLSHYIYKNKYDGEYLLPEFKHLDYLWLMKDDYVSDNDLQTRANFIRHVPGIQLVVELTNEKIKNKEHLIF